MSASKTGEPKKQTQKGGNAEKKKRRLLKSASFSRMIRVEEMKDSEF
jgi:hypothetical protein